MNTTENRPIATQNQEIDMTSRIRMVSMAAKKIRIFYVNILAIFMNVQSL